MVDTAPGHVETVRQLVIDALDPARWDQLHAIGECIPDRVDPGGDRPRYSRR